MVFHHHRISFCLNLGLKDKGLWPSLRVGCTVCLLGHFPLMSSYDISLESGLLVSDIKSLI